SQLELFEKKQTYNKIKLYYLFFVNNPQITLKVHYFIVLWENIRFFAPQNLKLYAILTFKSDP
ncbi:MAG: hypothetical protein ABJA57_02510, partial [Ginsengibacter sp.]